MTCHAISQSAFTIQESTFGANNVSFEINFRERKIFKYVHVQMALWFPFVVSVTCSRYQIAFKWSVKFWLQLFSIRWDGKYFNGWNFYLGILQIQENRAGRNFIMNLRVYSLMLIMQAKINTDWNEQQDR